MAKRPKAVASSQPAGSPPRRIPRDEEVVAALVKVILREGQVDSQARLHRLVEAALKGRNPEYAVGPDRVRVLALRSGLVGVRIRARITGPTPALESCPVCGGRVDRRTSRTLTGATATVGYRCVRCPYWTGLEYRVPQRYTFHARLEPGGNGNQTTFTQGPSPRQPPR